jgi:hypothetical protein
VWRYRVCWECETRTWGGDKWKGGLEHTGIRVFRYLLLLRTGRANEGATR